MNRILNPDRYRPLVEQFNRDDVEDIVNIYPNAQSWDWIAANAPLFDCPDPTFVQTYYYRWWCYRKHIKQTPVGKIVTEFISDVRHAGSYNSISCAAGFHLAEGRWLREQLFLDEYIKFWFRSNDGKPEPKFHNYSSWFPAAIRDRALATGDFTLAIELLDDLIADYAAWENEKLLPNGLFWQYDVRDAMEESISGSRKHKNYRPTINSYMFANALAIAELAKRVGKSQIAEEMTAKAQAIAARVHEKMWDSSAQFFMAQQDEGGLCDAREEIGFIPWMFNLPRSGTEHAWQQFRDPQGFWAPYGITTAERRHPKFRSHGVGKCEWDGAVWPFATSQTLYALANLLRNYSQNHVSSRDYLDALRIYATSHTKNGKPYLGEYHCELTGEWLKGDNPRSRYYNHSTFADLVITGLVGLMPQRDETLVIHPLIPAGEWEWFCVDDVPYHGRSVSVVWDQFGKRFARGVGLSVFVDGEEVARSSELCSLNVTLK